MLTGMTERDWSTVLEAFDAAQSSRGEAGHIDRKFLEAIHHFTVHSITWRALPREYVGTVFTCVSREKTATLGFLVARLAKISDGDASVKEAIILLDTTVQSA
jgi:hypothetical protein